MNKILQGDCIEQLRTLPDGIVQTCITSPPYYGLRDYGTGTWEGGNPDCPHVRVSKKSDKTITGHKNFDDMNGVGDAIQKSICNYCGAVRVDKQIGLEETPDKYIQRLVEVFREVKRVMKDDGTVWLNLGDSYWGGKGQSGSRDAEYQELRNLSGKSINAKHQQMGGKGKTRPTDRKHNIIKPKDLIGIPWRVAFALQADGWYLRQDIIWHKPNPMPESVTDRCTKSHEYIFLLTKSAKYWYDHEAIKENSTSNDTRPSALKRSRAFGYNTKDKKIKGYKDNPNEIRRFDVSEGTRNKRSVWTVNTKPYKEAHFAVFPDDLIKPCVLAGCPKGGIVYDPFGGSGTTAEVAIRAGRKWILSELNPEYVDIANTRLRPHMLQRCLAL